MLVRLFLKFSGKAGYVGVMHLIQMLKELRKHVPKHPYFRCKFRPRVCFGLVQTYLPMAISNFYEQRPFDLTTLVDPCRKSVKNYHAAGRCVPLWVKPAAFRVPGHNLLVNRTCRNNRVVHFSISCARQACYRCVSCVHRIILYYYPYK